MIYIEKHDPISVSVFHNSHLFLQSQDYKTYCMPSVGLFISIIIGNLFFVSVVSIILNPKQEQSNTFDKCLNSIGRDFL
jgi:hypothetical protein